MAIMQLVKKNSILFMHRTHKIPTQGVTVNRLNPVVRISWQYRSPNWHEG